MRGGVVAWLAVRCAAGADATHQVQVGLSVAHLHEAGDSDFGRGRELAAARRLEEQDADGILQAVPNTLDVTGMPCAGNQVYTLRRDGPIGGKPAYNSADGRYIMYSGDGEGRARWYLDSDLDPSAYYAYVSANTDWPPVYGWRQYCGSEWLDSQGAVLEPSLTADSCRRLAAETLALVPCRRVAETPSVCSVACAERWMPVVEHCGDQLPVLEAAAAGLSELCEATIAPVIATAPSSLQVSGLACHSVQNTEYSLHQTPHNGHPRYQAGAFSIYWTPSYGNTGGPAWVIDSDTDDAHAPCYIIGTGDEFPTGSSNWREWCDGAWTESRLNFVPSEPTSGWCSASLSALSGGLDSMCCTEMDGEACGEGGQIPRACTVDCAHSWSPYAESCPGELTRLQSTPLSNFFSIKCAAAAATLNVLPDTAISLEQGQTRDVTFKGVSGVRYEVIFRAAPGDGGASPCTNNLYDDYHGDGQCDQLVSSGAISCASDLAEGRQYEHFCDRTCSFECQRSGIASLILYVLPPRATENSQAVASEVTTASDKELGFTAAATGQYTVRMQASRGSGSASIAVKAVGTTEKRSPTLEVDGAPHPLQVACESKRCSFSYDGTECFDGNGNSFDLRIPNVQAGEAYAFRAALNPESSAAQVSVTLYQAGAAAGADGYSEVLGGPLGTWTHRSPGHMTYAETKGCANNDTVCSGLFGFGVYPDAEHGFKRSIEGTYVATASGTVLMRVKMSCDVPFFGARAG